MTLNGDDLEYQMGEPKNAYGDDAIVTMFHVRSSEGFIKHDVELNYMTVAQSDIGISELGIYEIVMKVEYID